MLACKRILTRSVTSALRAQGSSNEVKATFPVHMVALVVGSGPLHRWLSSQTDGEARIATVLKEKFPLAASLKVVDISGGCGAMYEIHIESHEFKGKRTVQQHKLVNQALKEEIQGMHGLRIFTDVPKH